jgi:hypothetical protein
VAPLAGAAQWQRLGRGVIVLTRLTVTESVAIHYA